MTENILKPDDINRRETNSSMSLPSISLDEINIPSPENLSLKFIYNFYTKDERVNFSQTLDSKSNPIPINKLPRYVYISWKPPEVSNFHRNINSSITNSQNSARQSISSSYDLVIKQDEVLNPGYTSHGFTSIDEIIQGTTDVENYSLLLNHNTNSIFSMIKSQISSSINASNISNETEILKNFTDGYEKLSNFPLDSLGLKSYDTSGKPIEENGLNTIVDKTRLYAQINDAIITDVFNNIDDKNFWNNFDILKSSFNSTIKKGKIDTVGVSPVYNDFTDHSTINPADIIGYIIERWWIKSSGNKKDKIYFVEDKNIGHFVDKDVLYGEEYCYSIRSVAFVKFLNYSADGSSVTSDTYYISSRPSTKYILTEEHTPPPAPDDIKFVFDHLKRNVIITWNTPVNSQNDIKGFQIFRRKSIKEPFELIAQYNFDNSLVNSGEYLYKTGERIDPNNFQNMNFDDKYLVKFSDFPVYSHTDDDFTVDTEFFVSSDYIYAVCSVDAHGMISNYSSQHRVVFDPYKNKIISKIICDSGSPKQYPNMNLRIDAFKDTIKVEGNSTRQLNLFFTPELLKVKDSIQTSKTYKIVEPTNNSSYYIFQLINMDNQKTQLLKINVLDPQHLTS